MNVECPLQQSEITQLTSFAFAQSNSCLMIAVTAFPDSWDNFFRTAMTVDPAVLALLIFHIWLKPKPTKVTIFFLPKYFPFLLLFPQKLLPETTRIP